MVFLYIKAHNFVLIKFLQNIHVNNNFSLSLLFGGLYESFLRDGRFS